MAKFDWNDVKSQSLAKMFDLRAEGQNVWQSDDLQFILAHQLSAPLSVDLGVIERAPPPNGGPAEQEKPPRTFAELFQHPHPPMQLLERTKEFAKNCRNRTESLIPPEVATVLYLLAIVVSKMKCAERISRLDDRAMQSSLDWALRQPWLDAISRGLLEEGRAAFEGET